MLISIDQEFTKKFCGTCGIVFFIPSILEKECLQTGQSWTCPNGHFRSYSESENAKYKRLFEQKREEVEALQSRVANLNLHIADLVKKVEKSKKGKVKNA